MSLCWKQPPNGDSIRAQETDIREEVMTSCFCSSCNATPALSRRQFLCNTAAPAVAASTVAGAVVGTASAQQAGAPAPGWPILIKGGCVLSLDRAVGDF